MVLLRHGTAVERGLAGLDDAERPLVPKGEREARHAGRALRALKFRADEVRTSPLVRARQTAQIAAAELGVPAVEDAALAPGFDRAALDDLIARHGGEHLVLVGHDPDFSELIRELAGAHVALAKGGAARIDLPGGELRWLLRPRGLRVIAKGA
jgi:phosphohistidine phosphatase